MCGEPVKAIGVPHRYAFLAAAILADSLPFWQVSFWQMPIWQSHFAAPATSPSQPFHSFLKKKLRLDV